MRWNVFSFASAAMLSCGLFLATPGALAQMRGGSSMGGQQPGGMGQQQPGTSPNGMQPNELGRQGMQGSQNMAELNFIANVQRNSKVETDLSKMALKNSSNDDVKKMAQQVIQENRRNEMALTSAASRANPSGMLSSAPVPSQTRQAEKQMKKLTGTQFDQMYLSQMDGYVKDDQKIVSDASANMSSADMESLTMQLRNTADERMKQITQVAQSENFKIQ